MGALEEIIPNVRVQLQKERGQRPPDQMQVNIRYNRGDLRRLYW
jgi:hypothetical protein